MKTFSQIKEEWSEKYKRSIDCDNPKGFSQKAHCLGRKKVKEEKEILKSHKTIESIAKKHKVDVEFIKKQLKLGKEVEKEHTKDIDLATDIALHHLDEIPDYYTKLKKVESTKKLKEHCGCEHDAPVEELEDKLETLKNISYDSIDKLMRRIMKKYDITAKELHNAFVDKNKKTPDDWIKDKRGVSEEYTTIQSRGMTYSILLNWKGKNILSQIFLPYFKKPSRKDINAEMNKIYPGCRLISFMPSLKDPTKPMIHFNEPR